MEINQKNQGKKDIHSSDWLTNYIGKLIFLGRWLQAPLYFGLTFILFVYVYRFMIELYLLIIHSFRE